MTLGGTTEGAILGTAAYMSPEQARGQPVDKRTDMWAFGCVLYEMLTGRLAFAGDTVTDTMSAIIEHEPDWQALPASTPAPVRRLMRRCLEKNRRQRLDSAAAARLEIDGVGVLSPDEATVSPRWRIDRQVLVATLSGAVIIASSAMAWWHVWSRPRPAALATSRFVIPAPENLRFGDSAPAISPDGRTIVFVATGPDGRSLLWLRSMDRLVPRSLAGTDEAMNPFWSPDSRTIGFFAQGQLKKVETTGGPPQVIADNLHHPVFRDAQGTWNRDGTIVFEDRRSLFRVSVAGGPPSELSAYKGLSRFPSFLPDERHFLFASGSSGDFTVNVGSLDSNEVKRIVPANSGAIYSRPGFLLFARGTTLMAQPFDPARLATTGDAVPVLDEAPVAFPGRLFVSVSDTGTLLHGSAASTQTELRWVDRHGRLVEVVAGAAQYGDVALSPDGTHVAFDRFEERNWDVWLMDLERRITSRFTSAPGVDNVPVWSADGRTVAFATTSTAAFMASDGVLDIGQRPSNLSGPAELLLKLSAPPIVYPADWSSDGRFLAYYRTDPKTGLDLWVLPLFGDRKPIPLLQSEFNESQVQFSPDSKWITYVSDESGRPQVYVQPFLTLTGKWQVSRDGGTQPRWRRDGKELFYLAADRKLMAVSIKTGGAFATDAPQVLFGTELSFGGPRQTYSVSPDGRRFLLTTPASGPPTSLSVTLNWSEELKARVP